MFRVDHNFSPAFKASTSFYWNRRPSVRNCEGVDGCNYDFDPATESAKNTDYYGSGFFQRISTHHAHQQFDWIVNNNLLSHSTVAWDRWFMGGNHLLAGANWPSGCGKEPPIRPAVSSRRMPDRRRCDSTAAASPTRRSGSRDGRISATRRTIAGSSRATSRGRGDATRSRADSSSAITTSRPAAGQEGPRRATSPSTASAPRGFDAAGNNLNQTGDPFASFLLGQVHDVESAHPGVPYLPGDIYRPVRQRRVQGFGQADADRRSALRL